jgi:hypothetical protein
LLLTTLSLPYTEDTKGVIRICIERRTDNTIAKIKSAKGDKEDLQAISQYIYLHCKVKKIIIM